MAHNLLQNSGKPECHARNIIYMSLLQSTLDIPSLGKSFLLFKVEWKFRLWKAVSVALINGIWKIELPNRYLSILNQVPGDHKQLDHTNNNY